MRTMTVINEKVPTNFVPAVAVKRGVPALFVVIWRKGYVDGHLSFCGKPRGNFGNAKGRFDFEFDKRYLI